MSAESDLFAALDVTGVNTLVSQRIYPDFLPEKAAHPAVVYARSNTEPITSISNVHFGDFVSFTVNAWGLDRDSVDAVADAIEVALRAAGHNVTGRDAGADPETALLSASIQVTLLSV